MFALVSVLSVTLSLIALGTTRSIAQDKDNKMGGDHGAMQGGMDQKAAMDAMMKAGMPGPEHQEMMKSAGTWDAEVKFFDMMKNQWSEPQKGTMKMEPVLDGHYLMMKFEGIMDWGGQKMPFKGMGIMGYDNIKKKYFSTWIDSMSTGLMHTEGTKQGNVATLTGTMVDPMSGKDCQVREVATHTDDSHMKYEMYGSDPSGKEMKMMEINYTKKM